MLATLLFEPACKGGSTHTETGGFEATSYQPQAGFSNFDQEMGLFDLREVVAGGTVHKLSWHILTSLCWSKVLVWPKGAFSFCPFQQAHLVKVGWLFTILWHDTATTNAFGAAFGFCTGLAVAELQESI